MSTGYILLHRFAMAVTMMVPWLSMRMLMLEHIVEKFNICNFNYLI